MTGSPLEGQPFDRADVERTVASVIASPSFGASRQLADFLTYIVARTLAGEQNEVKAYSIGVDALGRGEDFDPQTNAAVRVAAGRLRQALALYNAGDAAAGDPVTIDLQPGSYVPQFSARQVRSASLTGLNPHVSKPAGPPVASMTAGIAGLREFRWLGIALLALAVFSIGMWFALRETGHIEPKQAVALTAEDANRKPSIAVTLRLPEADYPDWFKPGELADALQVVLTRFDDYRSEGIRIERMSAPVPGVVDADYHFHHSVYRRGDEVRVFSSLNRVADGEAMWAMRQTFARPDTMPARDVENLVGRIFATLGSPYGLIYADLANARDSRAGLTCIVATFRYFYRESRQAHRDARACAEDLVDAGTRLPSVHAALTFLYLDEYREGFNQRERDPLVAARRAAERAVEYAPLSARSHQAMFAVNKVQGRHRSAQRDASRALALNPYDTDIMGDFASYLIGLGRLDEARELLASLDDMLQAEPAWLVFARFSMAFQSGDLDTAARIMMDVDYKRAPMLAFAAVIMARDGKSEARAVEAYRYLRASKPRLANAPQRDLMARGFDRRVSAILATAFQKAQRRISSSVL